jgi:hypothetical protein
MYGSARLFKLLLVPTILLGTGSVWAQKPPPRQAHESARDKGSLPDSVRRVERQTGGEVLRAEPMQRDGREVYRLKVLTADGRVRVVQEDPSDPQAGDRPKRRDRDRQKQSQSHSQKDSSEASDADPPL